MVPFYDKATGVEPIKVKIVCLSWFKLVKSLDNLFICQRYIICKGPSTQLENHCPSFWNVERFTPKSDFLGVHNTAVESVQKSWRGAADFHKPKITPLRSGEPMGCIPLVNAPHKWPHPTGDFDNPRVTKLPTMQPMGIRSQDLKSRQWSIGAHRESSTTTQGKYIMS